MAKTLPYKIYPTDSINVIPLTIPKRSEITTLADITFFGKRRLEYGEHFNENCLHLLEHFASHADPDNLNSPNNSLILDELLTRPKKGQIWFNKTVQRPYFWNNGKWNALATSVDSSGRMGYLTHLEYVPRPINIHTGYVYEYDECYINVSPAAIPNYIKGFVCEVGEDWRISSYGILENDDIVPLLAQYCIVAIKSDTTIKGMNIPIIQGDAPDRLLNSSYSYSYSTLFGEAPYTYTLIDGDLPPDIILSSSGQLTGPSSSSFDNNSYTFKIRVTDSLSNFSEMEDNIKHQFI